jgi:hypothetical protein
MASMELTPEESKAEGAEMQDYQPRYAVSEMYLGSEALKALGMGEMPKPGTVVRFMGTAKVVSVSARDDNRNDPDSDQPEMSMSLQPVELDVKAAAADARSMFPKSKMEP